LQSPVFLWGGSGCYIMYWDALGMPFSVFIQRYFLNPVISGGALENCTHVCVVLLQK
jgi:hypothetical protein